MTKSVLFPQKKTSSRLAALWQLLKTALCAIALLLTLAAAMASVWAQNTWENLEFEQIIGNLNIRPQDMDIFAFSPELKYYITAAAMLYLFLLAVCSNCRLLLASAVCAAVVVWQIRIIPYYYYQNTTGTLYEKYYKAPVITAADFPAQKRNLLLLYLESVENNFADASLYGRNLLPQLSEIAKRNPRFDGYSFLYGTNYTKAALVAGHCGIPYRSPVPTMESINNHLKNIRCLSDILADNGYETWFAKSADHSFAYTDIFYKMHSYSNIIDRTVLTAGMSPAEIEKNKSSYNGLSDRLLMDYISGLFTDNKVREPFLMTVFTVDTHAPGTVLPYNCPKIFGDIRDNILCTDNNIASFLTEFKKTPYWQNTTVVIVGDHPMFKALPTQQRKKYRRGIYNVFLNLPDNMSYNPRKEFTALDLAPTYLELLGIKLPEHAFGLGRSLFSDVPSLISLPEAKLETAIRQKSKVYDKFSILPPQKFVSYRLGTRLLNKDISSYTGFAEELLGDIWTGSLYIKLDKRPRQDLELKMTFSAMLSYKPMLTVKLNGKILQEIKLRKEPGDKTITVRIPAAGMETPKLAFEFINNNFRSALGQSINISEFTLKPLPEK